MLFQNDIVISGKHAVLIRKMTPGVKNENKNWIFKRVIDVYMNAAVWGLIYGKTEEKDISSNNNVRIFAETVLREQKILLTIYRFIMLLDKTQILSDEERINRAFRIDSNSNYDLQMELFDSYVRGGLELLYSRFVEGSLTRDDILGQVMDNVIEFKNNLESKNATLDEYLH